MIEVNDGFKVHHSSRAEQYHVDESGTLHLTTTYGNQIAAFAGGKWWSVRVVPMRGSDGRFIKRGNR